MIIAAVERLPFATKSFDFVICSHVIEHVEHPDRALRELERVGRRGYIETPSADWEKLAGFPFHRWLVSAQDGQLRLEAKPEPLWDAELQAWFSALIANRGVMSKVWFERRRLGVYTEFEWNGSIPFRVEGTARNDAAGGDSIASAAHEAEPPAGPAARVLSWYGRWLRRRSQKRLRDLNAIVICPDCRGALRPDEESYACTRCRRRFPRDHRGLITLLPSPNGLGIGGSVSSSG